MTLAARLAAGEVLALSADITHARRGALRHSFRTRTEHVLLSPESARPPRGLSLDHFNLLALYRRDHGGLRGEGTGAKWAWEQFAQAGLERRPGHVLALLTQPRFLGYWFNPVSFWMVIEGNDLYAVIAEVNNTFGERHCYLLDAPRHGVPATADKVFHVSPFAPVRGEYRFVFMRTQHGGEDRTVVRIDFHDEPGAEALIRTSVSGTLQPLDAASARRALWGHPLMTLGVIARIHWQALRLWLKQAPFFRQPAAPADFVTPGHPASR